MTNFFTAKPLTQKVDLRLDLSMDEGRFDQAFPEVISPNTTNIRSQISEQANKISNLNKEIEDSYKRVARLQELLRGEETISDELRARVTEIAMSLA